MMYFCSGDLMYFHSGVDIRRLLPANAHASFTRQRLSGPSPTHVALDRKSGRHSASQWPPSPLRTPRRLTRTSSQWLTVARHPVRHRLTISVSELFDLDSASTVLKFRPRLINFEHQLDGKSCTCSSYGSAGIFSRDKGPGEGLL
jgi:hypothetical protein